MIIYLSPDLGIHQSILFFKKIRSKLHIAEHFPINISALYPPLEFNIWCCPFFEHMVKCTNLRSTTDYCDRYMHLPSANPFLTRYRTLGGPQKFFQVCQSVPPPWSPSQAIIAFMSLLYQIRLSYSMNHIVRSLLCKLLSLRTMSWDSIPMFKQSPWRFLRGLKAIWQPKWVSTMLSTWWACHGC